MRKRLLLEREREGRSRTPLSHGGRTAARP
jgi:hypothetical protein